MRILIVTLAWMLATTGVGLADATLPSVGAQLDAVRVRLAEVDAGKFGTRLDRSLSRAERLLDRTESACETGNTPKAKRQLKRLVRIGVRAGRVVRSLQARRRLDSTLRTELRDGLAALVRDLKRLRRGDPCQFGSPSGAFV